MRDVCICIPVVHNPNSIEKVILECLDRNPGALIVIDDGSPLPLENYFFSHQVQRSLQGGQLKIIRQEQNLGRAAALLTGYSVAKDLGFLDVITVDQAAV